MIYRKIWILIVILDHKTLWMKWWKIKKPKIKKMMIGNLKKNKSLLKVKEQKKRGWKVGEKICQKKTKFKVFKEKKNDEKSKAEWKELFKIKKVD